MLNVERRRQTGRYIQSFHFISFIFYLMIDHIISRTVSFLPSFLSFFLPPRCVECTTRSKRRLCCCCCWVQLQRPPAEASGWHYFRLLYIIWHRPAKKKHESMWMDAARWRWMWPYVCVCVCVSSLSSCCELTGHVRMECRWNVTWR